MNDPVLKPPESVPPLEPPGQPATGPQGPGRRTILALVAGFALLAALAVLVIWVLPGVNQDHVQDKGSAAATTKKGIAHKTALTGPQSLKKNQEGEKGRLNQGEAVQARKNWFDAKTRAEVENMPEWAEAEYRKALALAQRGSAFFSQDKFTQATEAFEHAAGVLSDTSKSRLERLSLALEQGNRALEQGLGEEAWQHFRLALAIDPDNQEARLGLERAAGIGKVFELFKQAQAFFDEGNLERAEGLLSRALEADPHFRPASVLLEKTRKSLKRQGFELAMGNALSAFSEKDFATSRHYLQKAAALFPRDPAVRELKSQLDQLEQASRINLLLSEAKQLASREKWDQAIGIYQKVLSIDRHNARAQEGLAQAKRLSAINRALVHIIRHPERLREDGPLEDARRAIAAARAVKQPGQVLTARIKEASEITEQAIRPVLVDFTSDGMTEVTIYQVGRLGRFRKKTIYLRPGRYTVTGRRTGYRDVMQQVEIRQAMPHLVLFIACSERI